MELQEIKKINTKMKQEIIQEIEYMQSRTDDKVEAQLILQTKLSNLLIMMLQENERE